MRWAAKRNGRKEKDARRGLEMRRVREIATGGKTLSCTLEKAVPQAAPEPFWRPYCVAEDRRESGATIRHFGHGEQEPTYFGQAHRMQALESELEKLRAENSAMRSALNVIDRTLATVRRVQS